MNSVYITVGTTLILALVAALVGPMFVDWSAYRATFEQYGEEILGHEVAVLGSVDVQLLPSPSVSFSDVRVGDREAPVMVVARFESDIDLPSLLSGEVRVVTMKLLQPRLSLSLDEQGQLDLLRKTPRRSAIASLDPEQVKFDRIEVSEGSFVFADARNGTEYEGSNANLLLSARSLQGPFKASGSLDVEGSAFDVQLASGRVSGNGGLRLKAQIAPAGMAVKVSSDGILSRDGLRPVYDGKLTLEHHREGKDNTASQGGWSVAGDFLLDPSGIEISDAALQVGSAERPIKAEGRAALSFGAQSLFEIGAQFKQVDLDRILRGGPQEPVALRQAFMHGVAALHGLPTMRVPGYVRIGVPSLVVGGQVVSDFTLALGAQAGGWNVDEVSAVLPGRGTFSSSGFLELSPSLAYRGEYDLRSGDVRQLLRWLTNGEAQALQRLPRFAAKGRVDVGAERLALNDLRFDMDEGRSVGNLVYTFAPEGSRAKLRIDVDSDKLDVDQLLAFGKAMGMGKRAVLGHDLDLRYYADELNAGSVAAKSMVVQAQLQDDALDIKEFKLRDLAGAYVNVSGRVSHLGAAPYGEISGDLSATSLVGFAELLRRFQPDNAVLSQFEKAAPALAPATLRGKLSATADGDFTDLTLDLSGRLGVNSLDMSGSYAGKLDQFTSGKLLGEVSLGGADGVMLLRQLGLEVLPIDSAISGDVRLAVDGQLEQGLGYTLMGQLGSADLVMEGQTQLQSDGIWLWDSQVSVRADDLAPYGLLFGYTLPVLDGAFGVNLTADMRGTDTNYEISQVSGQLGDATVEGYLAGELGGIAMISGEGALKVDRADAGSIAALLLGPQALQVALDAPASRWPDGEMGRSLLGGIDLKFDFSSDVMQVTAEGEPLKQVAGDLTLREGEVLFEDASATLGDGQLEGRLDLRRAGGRLSLGGQLRAEKLNLADVWWRTADGPAASGLLEVTGEFEGMGTSIATLVEGLSGGGTFRASNGALQGMNPLAFARVISQVDEGMAVEQASVQAAFENSFAEDTLPFAQIEGTLALDGGLMRLRNVSVESPNATVFGGGQYNLLSGQFKGDLDIKVELGAQDVASADPQVKLLFAGGLDAPRQSLDVGPFLSYLNLRQIEQNMRRIDEEQARIAEQEKKIAELRRQQAVVEAKRKAEEEARLRAAAEAATKAAAEAEARRKAEEIALAKAAELAAREEAAALQAQQRATEPTAKVYSAPSEGKGVSKSFLDEVTSALKGAKAKQKPADASLPANSAADSEVTLPISKKGIEANALPALDELKTIDGFHERTVPAEAVRALPELQVSGEEKILVAPGDDVREAQRPILVPLPTQRAPRDHKAAPLPLPKAEIPTGSQGNTPRFREFPGRVLQID
ncbi:AsmA family protein [Polycladidibacter hongkongensis]|uniref:AsmA family protein n=1 Tax=Polycladidibacter hongkongensis TaxID=1647556 RepID=UPI00082D236C|nr:AsmA family protein [Pseudovibrio hongkongensis]